MLGLVIELTTCQPDTWMFLGTTSRDCNRTPYHAGNGDHRTNNKFEFGLGYHAFGD